jgi:hypothetical protein
MYTGPVSTMTHVAQSNGGKQKKPQRTKALLIPFFRYQATPSYCIGGGKGPGGEAP